MIKMEQPSFAFNSCDIGEPYYQMWKTTVGPKQMKPRQLAGAIEAAATNDDERVLAAAWADASDRIVDSINTLVQLLEKGGKGEGRGEKGKIPAAA